jgi:TPR repeat protein
MRYLIFFLLIVTFPAFGTPFDQGMDCFNKKNYKCALKIWEPLAETGNSSAMANLGYMYRKGSGVKQDLKRAEGYLRNAVKKGNAASMLTLGSMYQNGEGVEQDLFKASLLFQLSALYGDELAQFKIGTFYFIGVGVDQDYEKAKVWLNKSCNNETQQACVLLNSMNQLGNDKETLDMLGEMVKKML